MNLSAAISPASPILSWALLGVLCAWMVLCIFLALRPQEAGRSEAADVPTSAFDFTGIARSVPALPVAQPPIELASNPLLTSVAEAISDIEAPVA